jgi:hypothetical protein
LLLDLERLLQRGQIFANVIANGGNAKRRLDVGCAITLETQTAKYRATIGGIGGLK